MIEKINPKDYIITRKRKLYKFALFHNSEICYEFSQWDNTQNVNNLEIGAGTGLFSEERAKMKPGEC